jgi:hypothetical protein
MAVRGQHRCDAADVVVIPEPPELRNNGAE